jgi:hypothetical protein
VSPPFFLLWINVGGISLEGRATDFTLHRLPGPQHWVQIEVHEAVNQIMGG